MPSEKSCFHCPCFASWYAANVSVRMRSTTRMSRQKPTLGGCCPSRPVISRSCDRMLAGMAEGGVPFTSCSRMSCTIHIGHGASPLPPPLPRRALPTAGRSATIASLASPCISSSHSCSSSRQARCDPQASSRSFSRVAASAFARLASPSAARARRLASLRSLFACSASACEAASCSRRSRTPPGAAGGCVTGVDGPAAAGAGEPMPNMASAARSAAASSRADALHGCWAPSL
mmetsp:Transcript_3886/g.10151  ORF Transcript_3886/g.10151 Transcript_3886/m.10151 type:complete len:233 (-) Transcript_3886:4280-4978(-)